MIDGKVVAHDLEYDLATLAFDGGTLTVPNLDALIGEPVRVRVRARDVSIALKRPADISIQKYSRARSAKSGRPGGAVVDVAIAVGALSCDRASPGGRPTTWGSRPGSKCTP